jgi:hypothetical protein
MLSDTFNGDGRRHSQVVDSNLERVRQRSLERWVVLYGGNRLIIEVNTYIEGVVMSPLFSVRATNGISIIPVILVEGLINIRLKYKP